MNLVLNIGVKKFWIAFCEKSHFIEILPFIKPRMIKLCFGQLNS